MSRLLIRPDPPQGGEMPATEFVHPLPLAALALLAINDHLLKGSGLLPGWLTGKLSDLAGLFFFPLLLTAVVDVVLFGWNVIARRTLFDASLRTGKLVAAALLTTALFLGIKLSPAIAGRYLWLVDRIDILDLLRPGRIVQDPTDLVALPMVAAAVWFGRSRLAEVPPARLAALIRAMRGVAVADPPAAERAAAAILRHGLADCRAAARRPATAFEALVHGLAPYLLARATGAADPKVTERAERALAAWRGH
ncbi:MAG: hypothetical protein JXR83_20995 [Deltaproteobacteria bacterium]|nr:hypothetical protein [Deltaproteobacteria bacterium]